MTPPEAQRGYARRADRVVELQTGHHPMLSRPELLARVLAEAAYDLAADNPDNGTPQRN